MRSQYSKFRIFLITCVVVFCFAILMLGALKDVKNDKINRLAGRYIDNSLLTDQNNNPFTLKQKTIFHIHADFCPSCVKDKKLFGYINLKSKAPIIGIKWVDGSHALDSVYTTTVKATSTDFFVKLGMTTVPLTIIVGIDGQILYSHLGMLEQSEIDNAIIPIIHAK